MKQGFGCDWDFLELAKYFQGKTYQEMYVFATKCKKKRIDTFEKVVAFAIGVEKQRKNLGDTATIKIPEVKWADVGGLAHAKEDIR